MMYDRGFARVALTDAVLCALFTFAMRLQCPRILGRVTVPWRRACERFPSCTRKPQRLSNALKCAQHTKALPIKSCPPSEHSIHQLTNFIHGHDDGWLPAADWP